MREETRNKHLYEEASLFLYKIFTIDTLCFDNPKPLEKLTFERIFTKRCKDEKWSMVIFDTKVFAERELNTIEYYIKEIETYYPYSKNDLIYEPIYTLAKGYINYLNTIIKATDSTQKEENNSKYNTLHCKLVNYITISTENLQRLIEGDNIKPGTVAKWIGSRADAYRFAYWLYNGKTNNYFKKHFNNSGIELPGTPLHQKDISGTERELAGSIWTILEVFQK